MFTVLGLVNKPGNFEYPPGVDYNLMEAIAFAGGLNPDLEPRYAVIYRLKPDGEITHAIVDIKQAVNKNGYPSAMAVGIKPRDIIAIEHTPRTRTQKFILDTFKFSIGAYIRPFED
jgi:protein involved in polysaccharide export with SLBB domain